MIGESYTIVEPAMRISTSRSRGRTGASPAALDRSMYSCLREETRKRFWFDNFYWDVAPYGYNIVGDWNWRAIRS